MATRYEEIISPLSGSVSVNLYLEDGVMLSIPADESNTDYQNYLAWKAEQETA